MAPRDNGEPPHLRKRMFWVGVIMAALGAFTLLFSAVSDPSSYRDPVDDPWFNVFAIGLAACCLGLVLAMYFGVTWAIQILHSQSMR